MNEKPQHSFVGDDPSDTLLICASVTAALSALALGAPHSGCELSNRAWDGVCRILDGVTEALEYESNRVDLTIHRQRQAAA